MADLLFDQKLLKSQPGDEVRYMARIRTLTALRRLDGKHNKILIQFLRDAGLLGGQSTIIVDMSEADLHEADLHEADLHGADLHGANLHGANLQRANLQGANLGWAKVKGTDLSSANLHKAKTWGGRLEPDEPWLEGAILRGAIMPDGSVHE